MVSSLWQALDYWLMVIVLSLLELILSKPYLMPSGGMEIPSNWDGGCRQLERDESGAWQL